MAHIVLVALCAVLVLVSGRNDGAPLTALALRSRGSFGWITLAYLFVGLIMVPALGFRAVADALTAMMGLGDVSVAVSLGVVGAVLVTLALSNFMSVPTSITLALVGALAGSCLAQGAVLPLGLLARVILLGICAPLVAALVGYLLGKVPLTESPRSRRILLAARQMTLPLLALAYCANDGQKVVFVTALALSTSVAQVSAQPLLLIAGACLFILGTRTGVGRSGKFIRHGVASVRQVDLIWAEISASVTVFSGAGLGVPLSMTQSVTGAVAGAGASRSYRSIYWPSVGRIGTAWLWTLPMAAAISAAAVKVLLIWVP